MLVFKGRASARHNHSRAACPRQALPRLSRRLQTNNATKHVETSANGIASSWGEPVIISGAGIAGLATAVALSKVGIPVRVFESSSGLRQEGTAISFWSNAWRALDALGVGDVLRRDNLELKRVELCSDRGELLRSFALSECNPGPTGSEVRGLMRSQLLEALYEALPDRGRLVTFGTAVTEVLPADGDGAVGVQLSDGRTVYGSMLVGADGVGSPVARHLGLPAPRYSGYVAYRGIARFPSVPGSGSAAATGPGGLPLDTIRQVWGAGVRAGLYPVTATTYYWFTCVNEEEAAASRPPASPEERRRAALASVRGWAWDVEEVIRATRPEEVYWGRITDRWTAGSFGRGLVTLAGDAAHPMTPNLGQGGAAALEDAVVLGRKLGELAAGGRPSAPDLTACLRTYEAERSRRCLPLAVRSNVFGTLLQIPAPPVCLARNLFVRTAFSPAHFLDHAAFDCGSLPVA